jgi:hypothetical protein
MSSEICESETSGEVAVRDSPAAAGPSTGRDRVLAIRRSRSLQPILIKDRKYTVGFENTFATRALPVQGFSPALC